MSVAHVGAYAHASAHSLAHVHTLTMDSPGASVFTLASSFQAAVASAFASVSALASCHSSCMCMCFACRLLHLFFGWVHHSGTQ